MKTFKAVITVAMATTRHVGNIHFDNVYLEWKPKNEDEQEDKEKEKEYTKNEILEGFFQEYDFEGSLIPNMVERTLSGLFYSSDMTSFVKIEIQKILKGKEFYELSNAINSLLEDHCILFKVDLMHLN
jgi:hypothetical protein